MSFKDLYSNNAHRTNLAHFAAIASLAKVDGSINPSEGLVIDRFAKKLGISGQEYAEVMKMESNYTIEPPTDAHTRLERLYDLFKIVFADNHLDEEEESLVLKYAIGLGYPLEAAKKLVARSILVFSGQLSFDEYQSLL